MLNLSKTTTVPPDDPTAVLNKPIIKMIVIGDNPAIVQTADDIAQSPPIVDRQVVWFKTGIPANYQKQFNIADIQNVLAFSLGTNNKVGNIIKVGENVDDARMDQCYSAAE